MSWRRPDRPTVMPVSTFNVYSDVAILYEALKKIGAAAEILINLLVRRSTSQRLEIARVYKQEYDKNLINDIISETSGNFQKVLVSLFYPQTEFLCHELHSAMDGIGTNKTTLIEIMCSRTNQEILELITMYQKLFDKNLVKELQNETSGYLRDLLMTLCSLKRNEYYTTNADAAEIDARALKTLGVAKWGTDEAEFVKIMCLNNYSQIRLINHEYFKLTSHTLEQDIKGEFSGDIQRALLSILEFAKSKADFFAGCLYRAMKGPIIDNRSLIRTIVSRCEIDMADIKDAYLNNYNSTLRCTISNVTSEDYMDALLGLVGEEPE